MIHRTARLIWVVLLSASPIWRIIVALARFAGLSAFHLCRVFGETVGMTPHAYQTQVRVRHAKSLLQAGLPIALVAAEAGFYDQAHLTRHFKRIVGLTPGRYATGARRME